MTIHRLDDFFSNLLCIRFLVVLHHLDELALAKCLHVVVLSLYHSVGAKQEKIVAVQLHFLFRINKILVYG